MKNFFSTKLSLAGIFLVLVLFDLLSFNAFLYSWANLSIFLFIVIFSLLISLRKPVYALYIAFLELFIGSKGYVVFWDFVGPKISLRMALFGVVFLVWAIHFVKDYFRQYRQDKKMRALPKNYFTIFKTEFAKYYILLGAMIGWGIIWGLFQNNLGKVFGDANAWLYFLMIIPAFDFIKTKKQLKVILNCLFAAVIFITLKTLYISYIYSHNYQMWMFNIYRWVTDFGIGEISSYLLGFYRVFLQSQVFALPAFFISLTTILIYKFKAHQKPKFYLWLVLVASSIGLFVSFSRSYWVGTLAGLIGLFYFIKFRLNFSWKNIFQTLGILLIIFILTISIVYVVLILPPEPQEVDLASAVTSRLTQNEAAGQSRISQLKPLLRTIAKHPVIGHGFGKEITYQSFDPRHMSVFNTEGWYTAYVFEWGYLDFLLKFGLAGLFIYGLFLYKILKAALSKIRRTIAEKNFHLMAVVLGLLLGFIAVLITHIFSPYLNHPLGIGYLILFNLAIMVI